MKKILISDTHFGIKQNSMIWFKYQIKFIYEQLIPYIKKLKKEGEAVIVYHLGDVFDSRSSINPYIASNVRKAFKDIAKVCDGVWVIGGNHDYYSPNDNDENNVCSLSLCLSDIPNVTIVDENPICMEGDLLVPWYCWDDLVIPPAASHIFAHTDLEHLEAPLSKFKGIKGIYSGHIHTPHHQGIFHTLGSTYALTFADCNAPRGFYVIDNEKDIFIPNVVSIQFFRIKNDEIFSFDEKSHKKDDYIEIYIDQDLMMEEKYVDRIRDLSRYFRESKIIPLVKAAVVEAADMGDTYDIEKICRDSVPDALRDKFNAVLERISASQQ